MNYEFLNGAAIVKDKDNKYGVISSTGKMVVDFGEYEYITREGALYNARDKDSNDILFNSKGKIIKKDKEIAYAGSLLFIDTLHTFTYDDEKYTLYNYDGKEIMTFPKVEDKKIKTERKENYLSINYNNTEYIVDLVKAKVLTSFPTNRVYYIGDYNKGKSEEFILFDNDSNDDTSYILVRDGKVAYEIKDGNISFRNGLVLLNKNGSQSILNKKGEEAVKLYNAAAKDSNNDAKVNENGKVVIYVDGKENCTVDCSYVDSYSNGVYAFHGCASNKSAYYSDKGEKLFESEYSTRSNFDKNGYAILSNANSNMLINKKGEDIGVKYKYINMDNSGGSTLYIAVKEDNLNVLLDESGKELLTADSIYTYYNSEINIAYAKIKYSDGSYELYNTRTKKSIMKTKTDITAYNKYVKTSENGKTQYYSYTTGKMFFEE